MFERTILAAFVTAVSLADASFITAKPGPSPVLKARDADPDLLGWYYVSDYGGYTTTTCRTSYTWSSRGTVGGCCPSAGCDFWVGCSAGTIVEGLTDSEACPTSEACIVDYVLESVGATDTVDWVGCDVIRQATTFYRNSPVSTTATPTSSTTTTSSSTPTPIHSATPAPAKSKLWIVGAVVGPVVGLAIIAGLAFWILRLKRRETSHEPVNASATTQYYDAYSSVPTTHQPPKPPMSPPPTYPTSPIYHSAQPKFSETVSVQPVPEIRESSYYAPGVPENTAELSSGKH